MGNRTDLNDDVHRLPTGMKRIGYDADTQRYTFRSSTGALYLSESGSRYGPLIPVEQDGDSTTEDADERTLVDDRSSYEATRNMSPLMTVIKAVMKFKSKRPTQEENRADVEDFLAAGRDGDVSYDKEKLG